MKSSIGRLVAAVLATLAIMWVVPLPVYGAFSAVFGSIELPDGATSAQFVLSVTVIKIGFALAFVLLFELASTTLAGRWWQYAAIWWVMFALLEVGRAMVPGYSTAFAVAGIISEAIYFPLSTVVVARIMRLSKKGRRLTNV